MLGSKTEVNKKYLCGNQGNYALENRLSESWIELLEMELVKFTLPHSQTEALCICQPPPGQWGGKGLTKNTKHIQPHYYTCPSSEVIPPHNWHYQKMFTSIPCIPWLQSIIFGLVFLGFLVFLREDSHKGSMIWLKHIFSSSFAITH